MTGGHKEDTKKDDFNQVLVGGLAGLAIITALAEIVKVLGAMKFEF